VVTFPTEHPKHFLMARYFKLAPLVFCLCACLLLLVIGCAKAPADLVEAGRAQLVSDPAKALEDAQAAIDKLTSEPAASATRCCSRRAC
jgi:hypothetical protein